MTPQETTVQRAEALALALEQSVPLCTTRIEHVRVSGHAYNARLLAEELRSQYETRTQFETTHL